jgi:hypothetical protein
MKLSQALSFEIQDSSGKFKYQFYGHQDDQESPFNIRQVILYLIRFFEPYRANEQDLPFCL